jgi:hypothetical protein
VLRPAADWFLRRKEHLLPLFLLFAGAAGLFGPLLLSSSQVVSDGGADVAAQFLHIRYLASNEMSGGSIPLWNPYLYGGVPFLGDFQSALLYPPNLIFLVLPIATAINWSFFLHVFLLGASMYAWAVAGRGLRPLSGLIAGMAAMCGGSFFLHIYAGHLSNVCSMAWAPLVFLGIDGWLKKRHAGWIFLSSSAAALQIYAGHPQYAYDTALVSGLYALVHLSFGPRLRTDAAGLALIYPLAFLLAAVQILPGISAAAESARSGGTSYPFASMFSFPPENILTLIFPWLFGKLSSYWGRCYLWEMSLYGGTGMLLLAGLAVFRKGWSRTPEGRLLLLAVCALVLALGGHTFLHKILYELLPGFAYFRGASKFIFFTGLFLALLAGIGTDRLLSGGLPGKRACLAGIILGVIILASGVTVSSPLGEGITRRAIGGILATGEIWFPHNRYDDAALLTAARGQAAWALLRGGGLLMVFCSLFLAARRWNGAVPLLLILAMADVFLFARGTMTSFNLADASYLPIHDRLRSMPGEFRILNMVNPDSAILLGREGVWGYDPSVLKRYSQLVRQSQDQDPGNTEEYLAFHRPDPVLSLLRCLYVITPKGQGADLTAIQKPFSRFFMVSDYAVMPKEKVLEALKKPEFDLQKKVLLEQEPWPRPEPGKAAQAFIAVHEASTDHWILEVVNDAPGILVMTDAWSKDWKAAALPDSVQTNYDVLVADYALRAIPMAAGRHLICLEYVPVGFDAGLLLTLASLSTLGLATGWTPLRRRLDFSRA